MTAVLIAVFVCLCVHLFLLVRSLMCFTRFYLVSPPCFAVVSLFCFHLDAIPDAAFFDPHFFWPLVVRLWAQSGVLQISSCRFWTRRTMSSTITRRPMRFGSGFCSLVEHFIVCSWSISPCMSRFRDALVFHQSEGNFVEQIFLSASFIFCAGWTIICAVHRGRDHNCLSFVDSDVYCSLAPLAWMFSF